MNQARKKITIVGCTNLGKSSVFNLLLGKKIAITHDREGVTVDCRQEDLSYYGHEVSIIDTPGFDECHESSDSTLQEQINVKILEQIDKSDIILHVIDSRNGHNEQDRKWSRLYKSRKKRAIILANKIDITQDISADIYKLNDSEVIGISAKTGQGSKIMRTSLDNLLSMIESKSTGDDSDREKKTFDKNDEEYEFCIIGKPNSGKSTLINALTKETTSQISKDAGTTTDTVKSKYTSGKHIFTVYDTAGIRKKAKIIDTVERYSANQTIETIKHSNGVIVHMIDGTVGISDQDLKIIDTIKNMRKRHIIVINKWDKLNSDQKKTYRENIETITRNNRHIPVIFMSAYFDKNHKKLVNIILKAQKKTQLPPMSFLTKTIEGIVSAAPPPMVNGKQVKIRVAYPSKNKEFTITIQGKRVSKLTNSYKRYIKNSLEKSLSQVGLELEVIYKEDKNPYA